MTPKAAPHLGNLSTWRSEGKTISFHSNSGIRDGAALLAWLLAAVMGAASPGWGAPVVPEVRRVGLSQVGENTLLTVVLNRPLEPRVTARIIGGKPQLVVDFPKARAGRLPGRLPGDEHLVQQVLTETALPGGGVRVILELAPDQPYTFWKKRQRGEEGQVFFLLGLKPELPAAAAEPQPPVRRQILERAPEPLPAPPPAYGLREPGGPEAPGSFADLRRLMPLALPLLQGLERDGWVVSEYHDYDHPGQRFSRDFLLTHPQYSELVVKIAYLPANAPNIPNINIISLSTERLRGETADKYRGLRQWNFGKIKQHFEDIGDFFDDALKPMRVKLREETKTLALRQAEVFQKFLERACRNPQVAERIMAHVREKVSQRFEGVQYTVSEDPLVLLNLVDFLYVRVYFLETG